MNLNFILMEMTHLRYWMPLVIEGNKRGLQSTFFVGASGKYNCPLRQANVLKQISNENNINLLPIVDIGSANGIMFSSEKTGVHHLSSIPNCKKVVCTYQTDFIESYKIYESRADHILMPSEFCADFYDRKSDKNLYLGIPKYDVQLDEDVITNKYNLPHNKKALLVMAKNRDQAIAPFQHVAERLELIGYTILFKTRGKDPFTDEMLNASQSRGHFCFQDDSWHPHTTQELLKISDITINFGSTTIEECVMHNVPLVNFDIKPAIRNGSKRPYRVTHDYLYNYDYCKQLKPDFSEQEFGDAVKYLTSTDLTEEFKKARQNHLFDHKDSCKRILDVLL